MDKRVATDETAVRYLLGEMTEEEKTELELDVLRDEDAFERVSAAEDELIDDYLDGSLSAEKSVRFERLYLVSPERRERVGFARALRRRLGEKAGSPAVIPLLPPARRKELPRQTAGRRRAFALAAMVFAVVATAFVASYLLKKPGPRPEAIVDSRRIAVLPFVNQGQASEEYFSDGVSDEVRGKLAELPGIEVIARGSSAGYKKASKKLEVVARELSVGYLLTGTVRWENTPRRPGRVQISPALLEVRADGPPIMRWQQNFDASLTDVFEVQAGIAGRVAQAMNVVLSPPERLELSKQPTHNLEAWEAFLRGREISPAFSDSSTLRKAIAYYERAVELDPNFVQAWATLSRAHSAIYENTVPSPRDAAASRKAADKALALAPARPESLLAAGYYHRYVTKDYTRARENFEKAFRRAPADADVLVALADLDASDGRRKDAVTRLKLAQRIDPRSARIAHRLVMSLLCVRRYQEALVEYERGLGVAPRNFTLIEDGTMAFLAQGNLPAARNVLEQAARNVERRDLAVYIASYSDLYWALSPADQDLVLKTTPDAFDGDLYAWAIVQTQILWSRGEVEKAREFARKASNAAEAQLEKSPNDSPRHAELGLSYAYDGLREKAISEVLKAVRILPLAKDADRGAYIQLQLVRVYLLLGEPEKALDSLEPLLKIPFYVTPGWLAIDPTFDSLRGNPRFKRLVRQTPGPKEAGPPLAIKVLPALLNCDRLRSWIIAGRYESLTWESPGDQVEPRPAEKRRKSWQGPLVGRVS